MEGTSQSTTQGRAKAKGIEALEMVELRDGGKYKGEILAPSVMISDNSFFDGTVQMLKEGAEPPPISAKIKPPEVEQSIKDLKES